MKDPEEIIKYWCENDMGGLENLIHITQINAYNEALKDAIENVQMIGYYSEPNIYEGIHLKRFKRLWKNQLFQVEINLAIDKQSILKLRK